MAAEYAARGGRAAVLSQLHAGRDLRETRGWRPTVAFGGQPVRLEQLWGEQWGVGRGLPPVTDGS